MFRSILTLLLLVSPHLGVAQSSDAGPASWSVLSETSIWPVPTARGFGAGGIATLDLTCGGDGQPLMTYGYTGERIAPFESRNDWAEIDGRGGQITFFGQTGQAMSNPGSAFIHAMRRGRELVLYQAGGGRVIKFGLEGARIPIDQVLADCLEIATVPPAGDDMLAALKKRVRAEIEEVCRNSGATGYFVPDEVFQEVLRMSNPWPDVIVDYSFLRCEGGLGRGAGNCGAAKCLHQRYLPGETEYVLSDEYLDWGE
ncbi:MAG: hypothetical protein AAGA12_06985 [Pseudomonadota bacterium]